MNSQTQIKWKDNNYDPVNNDMTRMIEKNVRNFKFEYKTVFENQSSERRFDLIFNLTQNWKSLWNSKYEYKSNIRLNFLPAQDL